MAAGLACAIRERNVNRRMTKRFKVSLQEARPTPSAARTTVKRGGCLPEKMHSCVSKNRQDLGRRRNQIFSIHTEVSDMMSTASYTSVVCAERLDVPSVQPFLIHAACILGYTEAMSCHRRISCRSTLAFNIPFGRPLAQRPSPSLACSQNAFLRQRYAHVVNAEIYLPESLRVVPPAP